MISTLQMVDWEIDSRQKGKIPFLYDGKLYELRLCYEVNEATGTRELGFGIYKSLSIPDVGNVYRVHGCFIKNEFCGFESAFVNVNDFYSHNSKIEYFFMEEIKPLLILLLFLTLHLWTKSL